MPRRDPKTWQGPLVMRPSQGLKQPWTKNNKDRPGSQRLSKPNAPARLEIVQETSSGSEDSISMSSLRNGRVSSSGEQQSGDLDEGSAAVVYSIASDGNKRIEIKSKTLIKALQKINKHPTLQPPVTESIIEMEPVPTLFYHMDGLREEIKALNDEDAQLDLQALEHVTKEMGPLWREASEETFQSGLVGANMIWRLFQPGDLVIHEDDIGNLWAFVLVEISYSNFQVASEPDNTITFVAWNLGWDGAEQQLERRAVEFDLPVFSGRRKITSLPLYPIRFGDTGKLAKRGRLWWEIIGARTSCMRYDGLAFASSFRARDASGDEYAYTRRSRRIGLAKEFAEDRKKTRINDRVIIDDNAKEYSALQLLSYTMRTNRSGSEVDYRVEYQWDKIPTTTKLTDEQAMLCPAIIACYELTNKELYYVSVEKLVPIRWDEGTMDRLVLDDRKKNMLKGLVGQHYTLNNQGMSGDLISGKGQSLVILLHGPPGVGKTLTAECIAEGVQKPLITLSIGDLVWDEPRLQHRLREEFDRAIKWDAILLLDEADVVLEARSFEDIRRNGIVSVFLRQLEYYQGVLFLTTNRVSTMDTAFQSRIAIGISFKSMTPDIRAQVWGQLLALNGRDKVLGLQGVNDVKQKLSKYDLNGRQIRNVLNVAEGLAFNQYGEGGKLSFSHIKEAVDAAVEFQELLREASSNMKQE